MKLEWHLTYVLIYNTKIGHYSQGFPSLFGHYLHDLHKTFSKLISVNNTVVNKKTWYVKAMNNNYNTENSFKSGQSNLFGTGYNFDSING